jgi:hypothetical protein
VDSRRTTERRGLSALSVIPEARIFHLRNWPVTDVSADLISALAIGTHLDIAATDQIRPIATTTAIPIPARICIPLCVALSLAISG